MKKAFLLTIAASAVISVAAPLVVTAQTFEVVRNFRNAPGVPLGFLYSLTQERDGNFYGASQIGGTIDQGTVFRMTPDGFLTTLASFNATNGRGGSGPLIEGPDGKYYGTAINGGRYNKGTLFSVTTNGILTVLTTFDSTNGALPSGGLIFGHDGDLYGTTRSAGPSNGAGTVFKVSTDGIFTTLATFHFTNGASPYSGLTLGLDGNFYGTTYNGGSVGKGTAFKMTPIGGLTTLVSFVGTNGYYPWGGLTLGPNGALYGTTYGGGKSNMGSVFTIDSQGTVKTVASFDRINGAAPIAPLTLGPDGNIYGTTQAGGHPTGFGQGSIFKMTPDGILTTIFYFGTNDSSDMATGYYPYAGLTLGDDGSFYGTTYSGGTFGIGLAYRLNMPAGISMQPASRIKGVGTTVSFSVNAYGTKPLTYQWFKDGQIVVDDHRISGANTDQLTLKHLRKHDDGNYSVVVTNNWGRMTSSNALLRVLTGHRSVLTTLQPAGSAVAQPLNASGSAGHRLTFEGVPGSQYVVQYTTNIISGPWFNLSTNTPDTDGTWTVIDSTTDSQRFYRAASVSDP